MVVAVLDDGIIEGAYSCIGQLAWDVEVNDNLEVVDRKKTESKIAGNYKSGGLPKKANSHGTICGAIIKKYEPGVRLASIKVMQEENGRGDPEKVIKALEWCEKQQISVCHMSIGSQEIGDYQKFRGILNRLLRAGTIIIAAMSNDGKFSIPSDFPGIIRVKADASLKEKEYRIGRQDCFDADFYTSGMHILPIDTRKEETIAGENSFAAPVLTALVCGIRKYHPEYALGQIMNKLYQGACNREEWKADFSLYINRFPDFKGNRAWLDIDSVSDSISRQNTENGYLGAAVKADAPGWLYSKCREEGLLYFSRREYCESLKSPGRERGELQIPVIELCGRQAEVLKMHALFSDYLSENGYPNIVLSDREEEPSFPVIWIPDTLQFWDTARWIIPHFNAAAAIVCRKGNPDKKDDFAENEKLGGNKKSGGEERTYADITVVIEESQIRCRYDEEYDIFDLHRMSYLDVIQSIVTLMERG